MEEGRKRGVGKRRGHGGKGGQYRNGDSTIVIGKARSQEDISNRRAFGAKPAGGSRTDDQVGAELLSGQVGCHRSRHRPHVVHPMDGALACPPLQTLYQVHLLALPSNPIDQVHLPALPSKPPCSDSNSNLAHAGNSSGRPPASTSYLILEGPVRHRLNLLLTLFMLALRYSCLLAC